MNNLLHPDEVETIIRHVRAEHFTTNRKNVPPWCMQWFFGVSALIFIVLWLLGRQWHINRPLIMAAICIGISALGNIQWKRYKERWLLRQTLDKIEGEQGVAGYSPQVASPQNADVG